MNRNSSEKIIYVCRIGRKALLPYLLAGLLIAAVFAALGLWQVGAVLGTAALAAGLFKTRGFAITLTDEKIKYGAAAIPLGEIVGAACEQSFFGKIFGYCSLIVYTKGKTRTFKYISRAEEFRCKIIKQTDLYHFSETCREARLARELMENGEY